MKILLIDLSNTLSVGTHAYPDAQRLDGFKVGGIYYTVNKARTICARNSIDAVVAAVDWGVPAWRRELAPEYKAQRAAKRSPKDEEMHAASVAQRHVAWEVLNPLGITVVRGRGWEGDDVIAALALRKFKDHECVIASSDKDFTQLVDGKRIQCFDIYNERFREPDPHYCLKRCLDPKASDNLDGVAGCGPKTAEKLVQAWMDERKHAVKNDTKGMLDFIDWCSSRKDDKAAQKVITEQQIVRRNWKVTYMRPVAKECVTQLKYRRGVYNTREAMNTCLAYNLRPILTDFSTFDVVFSRLKDPRHAD